MEIRLGHANLNLFKSFGGPCDNENNFTRAFLVALTRSPWSPVLLRAFFDVLAEKLSGLADAQRCVPFLSSWPSFVEVTMQQGTAGESFLADGVSAALLVNLTPDPRLGSYEELRDEPQEVVARGIVDAIVTVRGGIGTDGGMSVIIESKLYGAVGEQQRAIYRDAIRHRLGFAPCEVAVSWDEVYKLTEHLPSEADSDPILADFKSFISSRPHLVGFTGFADADFANLASLDARLKRLCDRLAETEPFAGQVERKRGGLDYDLELVNQASLIGNVGVACWDSPTLSSKLVIGARSKWQTAQLLGRYSKGEVVDALRRAGETGRLRLGVHVRLYFNRFDAPQFEVTVPDQPVRAEEAGERWDEINTLARTFHDQVASDGILDQLGRRLGTHGANEIARARALPPDKRPKCFSLVVILLQVPGHDLTAKPAAAQASSIQEDLLLLAAILKNLST